MCGKTLSDEFLQAELNAAAGRLRPNALVIHVGTGPDLSDLPKNYSDSAVAD